MGISLVVVPETVWEDGVSMFGGSNVLALDDVLMEGVAGDYFRRLRIHVALHPQERPEYDRQRHEYLHKYLGMCGSLVDGSVIVGTHAMDVDLYPFSSVAAVRLSDFGLRELSKKVYGEAMMLVVEYTSVLRAIEEAVDTWHHVVAWTEIPMMIMRMHTIRPKPRAEISHIRQRQVLRDMLVGRAEADVWLEDALQIESNSRRASFEDQYDYLTAVRPVWRDAVVRMLGPAPAVEVLFKLPWFVVSVQHLQNWCYAPTVYGTLAVGTRGASLVDYVHTRLASVFTARELVGTWVGGILSDNLAAMEVATALGASVITPAGECVTSADVSDAHAIDVPREYAWMYEGVPDVRTREWLGERDSAGLPVLERTHGSWAKTLPVARVLSSFRADPMKAYYVVLFMRRMHMTNISTQYMDAVNKHGCYVLTRGVDKEVFDPGLTPVIPGFNYLACMAPSLRMAAALELGVFPTLLGLEELASGVVSGDGNFSVEELYGDAARASIYAGTRYQLDASVDVVGSVALSPGDSGYCYLCMFQPVYRRRVAEMLGAYPTLDTVLDNYLHPWYVPDVWTEVIVHCVGKPTDGLLHMDENPKNGEALGVFIDRVAKVRAPVRVVNHLRVGAPTFSTGAAGACVGPGWFTLAVVGWSIVGVVATAFIGAAVYVRCIAGRGGSGKGGRRNWF